MLTPKKTKTDKAIERYHQALKEYAQQKVKHEGALETAFQRLLEEVRGRIIAPSFPNKRSRPATPTSFPTAPLLREDDGGPLTARLGYWEAKDLDDDLDKCIAAKVKKKYPLSNTIFENTKRAVLYRIRQLQKRIRPDR